MSQIRLYIRRANRLYIANFENFEWLISCMKFSTWRYPELHSSLTCTYYTTINWHIDFHRPPPTSTDFRPPPTSTDLRRLPPTSELHRLPPTSFYCFFRIFFRRNFRLAWSLSSLNYSNLFVKPDKKYFFEVRCFPVRKLQK